MFENPRPWSVRLAHSLAPLWLLASLAALEGCDRRPTGAAPAGSASATTDGACQAALKKAAECNLTPAQAGLQPCDPRVAACIVGQGCEAIRKKETGCVFE